MTQCYNDCCLFYYRHKNKLSGLILFHVDDFLSSGTEEFHKNVIVELRKTYQFGKISSERFVFTGLQFYQNKEKEIFIDQFEYADRMELFQYDNQHPENILNKAENKYIRKSTGQLNWLASQTRPDLCFDSLNLSVCLNKATNKDAKYSTKVVKRAKEERFQIKFSHLGPIEDLHLELFADASLGNIEYNLETKSVM